MEGKKVKIKYLLSEEGRKKSLLAGGDGKEKQVVEADITPEVLELAEVDHDGEAVLNLTYSLTSDLKVGLKFGEIRIIELVGSFTFDAPQTAEQLIVAEKARRARIEAKRLELQPELERERAEYAEKQARKKAEEDKLIELQRKLDADRAAEKEKEEAERLAWIETHGSDYLQRAVKLGYNCQRQYVTERAAKEFPGYALDFNNNATWKDRACPSEAALDEVERLIRQGYDAEVVWLTEPIQEPEYSDDDDYCCFEPCETIVVRNYLGKYDLVKEI
jgi:hypothetical protein